MTWLHQQVGVPLAEALDFNTAALVVLTLATLLGGRLADRIGRRPVLALVSAGILASAWPLLALMRTGHGWAILAGQSGFALLTGTGAGAGAAAMSELFPRATRCTGVAASYNLATGLIGGTTPMVAATLIARTGDDLSPAFYTSFAAALSLIAALCLSESAFRPLDPAPG